MNRNDCVARLLVYVLCLGLAEGETEVSYCRVTYYTYLPFGFTITIPTVQN